VVFSTGHAASAADPVAPFIMKMATAAQKDHQTEFIDRFTAAIEKDSKGRIKVEEYPDGVLGSIPRMIENTQFGAIQAWWDRRSFSPGSTGATKSRSCRSSPLRRKPSRRLKIRVQQSVSRPRRRQRPQGHRAVLLVPPGYRHAQTGADHRRP